MLDAQPLRGTQPPVVAAPFKYDVVNDHWEWSDALYELHGYLSREIPATTDALISHKHPEDRERVAAVFAAAVRDGQLVNAARVAHVAQNKQGPSACT